MSLEDAIAKNTAAIERQNALLEKVLANAGATAPAKTEPAKTEPAKTEPAKTEPAKTEPAKTEAEPEGITLADLLAKLTPWMNEEFAKDHPETVARKAALKEVLGKLGEPKVSAITDAGKIAKLDKWFETKMKGVRLAPDTKEAAAEEEEL